MEGNWEGAHSMLFAFGIAEHGKGDLTRGLDYKSMNVRIYKTGISPGDLGGCYWVIDQHLI